MSYFYSETNEWKIEQSDGGGLVGNNFSPIPLKISFHIVSQEW